MAPKEGYPDATVVDGAAADSATKAKKPRPPPPCPPAAVGTAALLVRGAAARVLGLKPAAAGGDLQPVWVTEPGCSKVSISLDGSGRSPFPKEDAHDALLVAIEAEVAEMVKANAPISVFEMDRAKAEELFGESMYEPKSAKPDTLRLAYVPGALLVELPSNWDLCATTGACGSVTFLQKEAVSDKKKPETMILGKKKQLTIKYAVANKDASGPPGDTVPEASVVAKLNTAAVCVTVPGVDTKPEEPVKAAETATVADEATADDGGTVDPWEVKGKIDYMKLVKNFGSSLISEDTLAKMKRLTVDTGRVPCLHHWLRRNIFFSHRDMDAILNCKEKGTPFYLYTGRGPSSGSMHLGHLIPFLFTKWLQEAFDVPLVIQMTDDEKFLWKGEYDPEKGDNLMYYRGLTTENAKDIIACGFDKKKTFIFSDLDYVGHMYPNIVRTWKAITYSTAKGAFGFQGESNIGQSAFPAIQAVPSFASSFKIPLRDNDNMACLIPCAIDQDPYFRVTRDIAHKLVPNDHPLKGKPSLIHSKFFPPLQGADGKMSASDTSSAIFLTDTPEQIEYKIKNYALSGGRQTAKEQREKGADLDVDVPYQWLRFFLEDDVELEKIKSEYGTGQGEEFWSTGQVKARLIKELQKLVAEHQERRKLVTDEVVAEWMKVRPLEF